MMAAAAPRDSGGDSAGVGGVGVAEGIADGPEGHAPQGAGGAAGLVGPGVSGEVEGGGGAGAAGDGVCRGVDGGADAALHADAVVAVAGDRVDPAEFLDVGVHDVLRGAQRGQDADGRRRGMPSEASGIGRFDVVEPVSR